MCVCVRVCVRVCVQVRAAEAVPRGLLWLLDEEMVTPGSTENAALERVCQYYSNTGTPSTWHHYPEFTSLILLNVNMTY